MTIKESLRFVGMMILMLICAAIGFATWMGIGVIIYCLVR